MTDLKRHRGPDVETRLAIDDLLADYLWALDTQDLDRYVDAFWPDGALRETQLDSEVLEWRGADAIRAFTAEHFDGYSGHQHRDGNRLFLPTESADRWIVRSYWFATHRDAPTNEVTLHSTGHSADVVERRDGEWRIADRLLERWPGSMRHPLSD